MTPPILEPATFTQLEWIVIGIARRERRAIPRAGAHGLLNRLRQVLNTGPQPAPLANPRLEALRQTATSLPHLDDANGVPAVAKHQFSAFFLAGFTNDHFRQLVLACGST